MLLPHSDSSSQYSDWIADAGINLHPPVRKSQRKIIRYCSSSEDEASVEKISPPKRRRKRRKKYKPKKHEVLNFIYFCLLLGIPGSSRFMAIHLITVQIII